MKAITYSCNFFMMSLHILDGKISLVKNVARLQLILDGNLMTLL